MLVLNIPYYPNNLQLVFILSIYSLISYSPVVGLGRSIAHFLLYIFSDKEFLTKFVFLFSHIVLFFICNTFIHMT